MALGVLLTIALMTGVGGTLLWLIWRRLAEHMKENPDAVAALATHLFVPLLGKKPKEPPQQPQG